MAENEIIRLPLITTDKLADTVLYGLLVKLWPFMLLIWVIFPRNWRNFIA